MNILIAHDEAFNFTYRANIDSLKEIGNVEFFSPLHDGQLSEADLIYLPGGYPELFADRLSANKKMRNAIKAFAGKGGRIFAECGGFMYLCNNLDGMPMCGVLPLEATMNGARLHLGYRQAEHNGITIRGHEFHYSSIVEKPLDPSVEVIRIQKTATGKPIDTPIYRYKNVIAGYTHWYWAENINTLKTLFYNSNKTVRMENF